MSTPRPSFAAILALAALAALPAMAEDGPPLLYRKNAPAAETQDKEETPNQRRWQSRHVAKYAEPRPEPQPAAPTAPTAANAANATTTPQADVSPPPEKDAGKTGPAFEPAAGDAETAPRPAPAPTKPPADANAPTPPFRDIPPQEPQLREPPAPPTPEGVENYRRRLEARLLEKYNNIPEFAGNVAKVDVVLSRPPETSVDGTMIRAEFDQLVHDAWGKRIPALEREYFVVTFGAEGVRQVRSDPSIRVGLDLEKTYSERAPLAADPFRNAPDTSSFAPAPQVKMPAWWRPEYPELD